MFAIRTSRQKEEIGTGKSNAIADAVGEEVDFLCGLVGSHEKERTDMKLEKACMKREIADIKLEINTLIFGLQSFAGQ